MIDEAYRIVPVSSVVPQAPLTPVFQVPLTGGIEFNTTFPMSKNDYFFLIHASFISLKLGNCTVTANFNGIIILEANDVLIKM